MTELPIEIKKELEDHTVMEKETATFTTELSKPDQPIRWFINKKEVEPSAKYEVSLTILV